METREDRPQPAAAIRAVHVGFGTHHVVARSDSPAILAEFSTAFGPMITLGPAGTCAGVLQIVEDGGAFRIAGCEPETSEKISDPAWAARELFHAAVKLLMLARQDLLWFHAGAVARNGRAIVLCGPSGQGKSTLVGALLDRGWTYLSDEIAPIDCANGAVHPFPVTPHRRVSDGTHLADLDLVRQLPKVAVGLSSESLTSFALPIGEIHFLRYIPGSAAVEWKACSPAEAVLEMLRNSLSLSSKREREIAAVARLVGTTTVGHLVYADAEAAAAYLQTTALTPQTTRR